MTTLRVFTFTPDWGLPSAGPFAIKLLAWLELAGIPHEQVIEDNPRGPKGKNLWLELDGEPIGDTELIIDLLSKRYGADLDAGLSSEQKAIGLAWRRTFEEHFHSGVEWELFEHPAAPHTCAKACCQRCRRWSDHSFSTLRTTSESSSRSWACATHTGSSR